MEAIVKPVWHEVDRPPPHDPDLRNHDIYFCEYVEPCAHCLRVREAAPQTERRLRADVGLDGLRSRPSRRVLGCSVVRHRIRDLLFVATDAPGDDDRRGAATRGVVALAATAFCLSLACAFTMPILFGVDERVHLAYVEVLLGGDLPEVDQDVPLDGHFPVLREYYAGGTEDRRTAG